tara:strand:- start:1920 stop:2297 length:378 start_codon:yes stop_codon:yes gene_type:complete
MKYILIVFIFWATLIFASGHHPGSSQDPLDGIWKIIFDNGIIGLVLAGQAFWIYRTDKSHREETQGQLNNYIKLINKANDHENKMENIMGNMNGRMENLEREVENLRDGQKDIEKLFIERITKLA